MCIIPLDRSSSQHFTNEGNEIKKCELGINIFQMLRFNLKIKRQEPHTHTHTHTHTHILAYTPTRDIFKLTNETSVNYLLLNNPFNNSICKVTHI